MNNRCDVSWQEIDNSDEECPLATYSRNDDVSDSKSHLKTLLVDDTENGEDNVIDSGKCKSESDYIPSEEWQRRNNHREKTKSQLLNTCEEEILTLITDLLL